MAGQTLVSQAAHRFDDDVFPACELVLHHHVEGGVQQLVGRVVADAAVVVLHRNDPLIFIPFQPFRWVGCLVGVVHGDAPL